MLESLAKLTLHSNLSRTFQHLPYTKLIGPCCAPATVSALAIRCGANILAAQAISTAQGAAPMRVLLVEDHEDLAIQVQCRMRRSGFAVDKVGSIKDALVALACFDYPVAVFDRRLPDGDSLTVLPRIREQHPHSWLLILTALDAVDERISGLDAGADDYLTKPFDLDELMARIRASLRRYGTNAMPPVRLGALTFDLSSRNVFVHGKLVALRQRELALLEALVRRAGRIVERETLMTELWGFDDDVQPHALTIIASRLRTRLQELDANVEIQMVRGIGYFITDAAS